MVVLFALMPPWWTDPVNGVIRFLESNLSRGKTQPDPDSVSRHRLQHPERIASVVQHAGLDAVRHPGRLLDPGGTRILDSPEILAKRADRALDRGTLGFLDASALAAAHAGP